MIQKIQTLQKRLISKTEEVVEKELMIQEKEKLYVELKHILARQPGPEVAEQLQIYQQTLKEKTKQMKVFINFIYLLFYYIQLLYIIYNERDILYSYNIANKYLRSHLNLGWNTSVYVFLYLFNV